MRVALADHGVGAGTLVIEITEAAFLRATPTTVETLQALRELGVRVVIDDFGTSYFPLSHLRELPVDALKIASEFTRGIDGESDARSSALAAAIVAMAHSLGIETVAEGIETEAQADWMRSVSCTYAPGLLLRPAAAARGPPGGRQGLRGRAGRGGRGGRGRRRDHARPIATPAPGRGGGRGQGRRAHAPDRGRAAQRGDRRDGRSTSTPRRTTAAERAQAVAELGRARSRRRREPDGSTIGVSGAA